MKSVWDTHADYLREMTSNRSFDDETEKPSLVATAKKPGWYSIQATAKENAEIYIYDEISSWGITASAFVKDLNAVKVRRVTLHLNSPGGNVFDGMAIYTALKNHPATVNVEVDGLAASIASIIAMAGDTIHVAGNAFLMIHGAWSMMVGNSAEMSKMAETLDKIDAQMLRIYARRSGQSEEKIREMMDAETWMDAEEAKGFGFADTIGDEVKIAASFDLSKYRNAPGHLNARVQAETLRESEKRFRSKGHSRREAEQLAENYQKNLKKDGDDMTPEQLAKLNRIDNINARLDEVSEIKAQLEAGMQKIQRLSLGGGSGPVPGVKSEEMRAFATFLRTGDAATYRAAVNVTTDSEGGYGVPEEIDKQVAFLAKNYSAMRQVSNVIEIGTPNYVKLVSTGGTASGWVSESAARPETASPGLAALTPAMGEIYTMPSATQTAVDDIVFDVAAWLAEESARLFAEKENLAFTTGNGVGQPKGLLAYTTSALADGARTFGQIQHIVTGDANGFIAPTATASPADILFDVIAALKPAYRAGASWMMNRSTLAIVRKWKDYVAGNFLYLPSLTVGMPATLCGYPVVENEDFPSVAAGNLPIAFGDFRQAFYITDRKGMRLLVDPYTNRPYINYYLTKRTGSMLVLDEAVKLVKCALA